MRRRAALEGSTGPNRTTTQQPRAKASTTTEWLGLLYVTSTAHRTYAQVASSALGTAHANNGSCRSRGCQPVNSEATPNPAGLRMTCQSRCKGNSRLKHAWTPIKEQHARAHMLSQDPVAVEDKPFQRTPCGVQYSFRLNGNASTAAFVGVAGEHPSAAPSPGRSFINSSHSRVFVLLQCSTAGQRCSEGPCVLNAIGIDLIHQPCCSQRGPFPKDSHTNVCATTSTGSQVSTECVSVIHEKSSGHISCVKAHLGPAASTIDWRCSDREDEVFSRAR